MCSLWIPSWCAKCISVHSPATSEIVLSLPWNLGNCSQSPLIFRAAGTNYLSQVFLVGPKGGTLLNNFSTSHFLVLEFMEDNILRAGNGWLLFSLCLSVFPSVCLSPFLWEDHAVHWPGNLHPVFSRETIETGHEGPLAKAGVAGFFLGLCFRERMQPVAMILQNFLLIPSGGESYISHWGFVLKRNSSF